MPKVKLLIMFWIGTLLLTSGCYNAAPLKGRSDKPTIKRTFCCFDLGMTEAACQDCPLWKMGQERGSIRYFDLHRDFKGPSSYKDKYPDLNDVAKFNLHFFEGQLYAFSISWNEDILWEDVYKTYALIYGEPSYSDGTGASWHDKDTEISLTRSFTSQVSAYYSDYKLSVEKTHKERRRLDK